ncbi:pyruvate kinase alpha/beta domain-containing protein [Methanococcus voltae]|uniref:Pyruvate kinase C-terminal domain-containing protein n=1 Tax=Methanococcus voltae (strain ATCC BAA-1334 / A3) TaxID=456320 RepID=D7DSH7_METV3|nr:pyruvate kinase alpha/beta domain-containing protein [Methanococcus voltae]MCS3901613.1 hypothetical protein [Methanococcus voltae]
MYFEQPGVENTEKTLKCAIDRLKEDKTLNDIVLASTTGETALKLVKMLEDAKLDRKINVVSITYHQGFSGEDINPMSEETANMLKSKGVNIVRATHALSGVERGISKKFGGYGPVEIIAETLRTFGQGLKVAYEITVMAADSGYISTKKNIIALGGSSKGSDCAVIIKPANMNNFFDIELKEILCKPKNKKKTI